MRGRYARYAQRRRGYAQSGGYGGSYTGTGPLPAADNTVVSEGIRFVDLDPAEERDIYLKYLPEKLQYFILFEAEINWNTKDIWLAHSQQGLSWHSIDQQVRHMDRAEYIDAYPDMGVTNPYRIPPPPPRYETLW